MELFTMRCPNCGADLEVENGIDSLYCKYCGTKILVSGQDKHTVRAKAVVNILDKIQQMDETERQYYEDHKEEIEARKRQEERRNNLQFLIGIGIILAVGLLCLLIPRIL